MLCVLLDLVLLFCFFYSFFFFCFFFASALHFLWPLLVNTFCCYTVFFFFFFSSLFLPVCLSVLRSTCCWFPLQRGKLLIACRFCGFCLPRFAAASLASPREIGFRLVFGGYFRARPPPSTILTLHPAELV